MPKLKTKTSADKRINVSKNGKLMRRSQNARHLKLAKSTALQRRQKEPKTIYKAFAKKLRRFVWHG